MREPGSKYILDLIAQGEHSQLDFKFEISDARKIARTFAAFANTNGGRLLVGVKDNGRISGITSEEEYYMVESAAYNFCKPEVRFETHTWQVEGKTVLEVYIHPAEIRPVHAKDDDGKWMAYHRVKDENYLANRVLLELWKYDRRQQGSLIEFTRHEDLLLKYLSQNPGSSLSGILKDTGFRRRKLIDLLVKLIAFDVVRMSFSEGLANFSLSETPGKQD